MPQSLASKGRRLGAITRLLASGNVRSQGEFVELLRARGFEVTQSSVSRDLREMQARKIEGVYRLPGGASGALTPEPQLGILSVAPAGAHLLVLRTFTGGAARVGLAIDASEWPGIVGTIAGDDTVFIALSGRRDQAAVQDRLARLIAGEAVAGLQEFTHGK